MDLLMIFILPILGIMSVVFLIKQRIKKFPVYLDPVEMKVMGCNIFPMLHLLMAVMPDSMRRQAITKQVNILGGGILYWNQGPTLRIFSQCCHICGRRGEYLPLPCPPSIL